MSTTKQRWEFLRWVDHAPPRAGILVGLLSGALVAVGVWFNELMGFMFLALLIVTSYLVTQSAEPIDAIAIAPPPPPPPAPRPPPPEPKLFSKMRFELAPGIGLQQTLLQAGNFTMGSPKGESGRYRDESPTHTVYVSAFWCDAVPVTRKVFAMVMERAAPSVEGGELPATGVNWTAATEFCNQLSSRLGFEECYDHAVDPPTCDITRNGFRLPTEAEWEYACRAGTTSRYSFGDDDSALDRYAWYNGNSDSRPHAVGAKQPNQWGLFDMHGNVWEWVNDRYADRYAPEEAIDPTGPETGALRVLRGGAFANEPWDLRSALRNWIQPAISFRNSGFRCVRSSRRQP